MWPVYFEEKSYRSPLQIADACAWAIGRRLSREKHSERFIAPLHRFIIARRGGTTWTGMNQHQSGMIFWWRWRFSDLLKWLLKILRIVAGPDIARGFANPFTAFFLRQFGFLRWHMWLKPLSRCGSSCRALFHAAPFDRERGQNPNLFFSQPPPTSDTRFH